MKLQSTSTQEIFSGELTAEHPASIVGLLAIRRLDTGSFIALREVLGVLSPFTNASYQLLEVTPDEREALKKAGIVIAENVNGLQNWYNKWDGPK